MQPELAQHYPAHLDTLCARANKALDTGGFDHLVVHSGSPITQFLDDNDYPFKVNPQFKAWAPILDNPHCWIIYSPNEKPLLLYYQPVDYWHKPREFSDDYWTAQFTIHTIADPEEARGHLPKNLKNAAFISDDSARLTAWGITHANPEPVLNFLHFKRAWKTEYELACMRQANLLGAKAHMAAAQAFRDGASEYEIHLAYCRACDHTEEQLPYGNIIAFNENGATLHYQDLERQKPARTFSFLIDAGTTYKGYASDITRTYSSEDDEFQALINAMDAAQQAMCAEIRPGLDYKTLHLGAHTKIAGILKEFDFISVDAEDAVASGISSSFFPHGLGHYLGLQVHDVGGFMEDTSGKTIAKPEGHPFLRLTRSIDVHQVMTIEPGLYFIDSLLAELKSGDNSRHVNWDKVDAFRKYGGVRVEDDVRVSENGHENLTRNAFAKLS